ncbi:MAG: hypothetical protein HYX67_09220 [Candidatus Melainabacteria bacterium]|nr:hypothetical protein [Candidatus Melainabacteria bacterium]
MQNLLSRYSLMQRNVSHSTLIDVENSCQSPNGVIFVKHEKFVLSQSPSGEHWMQALDSMMLARWN